MSQPAGRLLSLLSLLQTRRDWGGDELANRLDISPRTVRRDVDRLRELGYPVQTTKGPHGGYRLAPGSELPPLLFDDEQAVAIAVALQTAASGIAGVEDASLRALATIRQVLPAKLRHRVDALQVTAVRGGGGGSGVPDESAVDPLTLLDIGACCRDHQQLRFDYVAKDGVASARRTEPHRLVSRGRRWYVVAWDLDRDDWRTFRVDRMRPKTPVGPRFTPRELSEEKAADLLSPHTAYQGWPVTGTVLMHAPAREVARWLPAAHGSVTEVDANSCRVEMGGWSWGSVVAWLLLYEVDIEVIGPPELAAAVDEVADRLGRVGRAG
ncbi:helix-turn-helix transcriptional regulator [Ornithinimicrobium sp. Y1847]|uniref:helix-turn-helix transcriptional regulator n=1 Tax=Ornithinimicrobium sp. Y1847 TaxID=3405419 RepID=UPI003B67E6FA